MPQPLAQRSRGFSPSVIEGSLGRVPQVAEGESLPQTVSVPVMGRIAAGVPIEAIQTRLSTIEVPPELLSKGEHYALEVKGDSMIEAGILEGDTIIVRKCEDANNGDIVVALVDEEEATLKRLRRRGDSIALEAANPLRDAHLRPRPRARAGPPRRPDPPLLGGPSVILRLPSASVARLRSDPAERAPFRRRGAIRHPRPMPARGCNRLGPDREALDIERMRALHGLSPTAPAWPMRKTGQRGLCPALTPHPPLCYITTALNPLDPQSRSSLTAMSEKVITRFAPSPTGYLHIGGARTALFNWLYAKHTGGKMLLRIEDTDQARSTEGAILAILDGLRWLELDWDGEPVYQLARAERHREIAEQLLAQGNAYRCYASAEELAGHARAGPRRGPRSGL